MRKGFTLIELLIALAVFAVVATTVYTRSGESIRQLSVMEERTLATWLADNELALLRMSRLDVDQPMPTGSDERRVVMAGRDWTVRNVIEATSHPWLRRVEVEVLLEPERGETRTVHTHTGFLGRY
ncbi:MAG: type II secretion system minor pseudopilin GspI [Gammaproteobacteria bacterium]|nr:type II secretion system minor pseudopilin GspI [Gammaproteobacteria bacterium]